VKGKNGAGKVFLRAAPAGTGIIAGGPIRSVCEVLGIQDIVAKSLGSANPHNVLKACVNGLKSQSSPKLLSSIRGKKISDIVLKREAK
jgi:small subunit ribosomal protein S5